jgi:hypothetical protein
MNRQPVLISSAILLGAKLMSAQAFTFPVKFVDTNLDWHGSIFWKRKIRSVVFMFFTLLAFCTRLHYIYVTVCIVQGVYNIRRERRNSTGSGVAQSGCGVNHRVQRSIVRVWRSSVRVKRRSVSVQRSSF